MPGNTLRAMTKAKPRKALEPWQVEDAARLKALFESRTKLSQDAFGAKYGIGSQGLVSQYLIGHIPLNVLTAARFAIGLGCGLEEISPTLASLGREIAASLSGWGEVELDLIESYQNAPEDARRAIFAAHQPFIPKRRSGGVNNKR
jgi:hypothetical protein